MALRPSHRRALPWAVAAVAVLAGYGGLCAWAAGDPQASGICDDGGALLVPGAVAVLVAVGGSLRAAVLAGLRPVARAGVTAAASIVAVVAAGGAWFAASFDACFVF